MTIYSNKVIKTKIENRKKRKKVYNVIYWVFAAILFVCLVVVMYQKFIKKYNSVSLFGYSAYVVLSGSMYPAIDVGDIVIVSKSGASKLGKGDVVTFVDGNGSVVTHRITDVVFNPIDCVDNYKTKGDSNNSEDDGLISPDDIIGKYCFKLAGIGLVIDAILTPLGISIIALVIALFYFNCSRIGDRKKSRHILREKYKEFYAAGTKQTA